MEKPAAGATRADDGSPVSEWVAPASQEVRPWTRVVPGGPLRGAGFIPGHLCPDRLS